MAELVEREVKLPHFFAQAEKDSMRVEQWVARVERLRNTHGWTSLQTVGHAINALRGEAIDQLEYFAYEDERAQTDWAIFKEHLLLQYGTGLKDTSSVANLQISQGPHETVAGFNARIMAVMNEFLMMAPSDLGRFANFQTFLDDRHATGDGPLMAHAAASAENQAIGLRYIQWSTQYNYNRVKNYLCMTLFINGLRANLQPYVKQARPTTWKQAIMEAHRAQKIVKGPETKTLSLEQPGKAASINATYRGRGGRGRGSGPSRGGASARGRGGSRNPSPSQYTDRICYYCNIKGHVQAKCRKRIARNAKGVSAPRSVNEIAEEDLLYQDEDLGEDSQQDDYLTAAINQDEEEYDEDAYVNSLQINSLHLN